MDKKNIEINITEDHEWVERIGKTAYEIYSDSARDDRINLNNQHTGFIMESNDAAVLGCLGWAIEQHLDAIPAKLRPTFRKILDDIKARKDNLEMTVNLLD